MRLEGSRCMRSEFVFLVFIFRMLMVGLVGFLGGSGMLYGKNEILVICILRFKLSLGDICSFDLRPIVMNPW